jgi:aminopeptidase N
MYKLLIPVLFVFFLACKSTKPLVSNEEQLEEVVFDTLEISNEVLEQEKIEPILPYNPSAKRSYDLLHTKLNLSFDWEKQHVIGEADLTLKPLIYDINSVELDAKGMIIHSVKKADSREVLEFEYDNAKLNIRLSSVLKSNEEITLYIKYTARPNASEGYSSGAISSDKGLFFIDPEDKDPNKPSQIWTQGETENNSRWFPTFDKPNERCSQEIYVKVDEKYSTLSNGVLISSKSNRDGTGTDYWKQDKPHAPYLFMLAIGEYAWVNDRWNDVALHYIVEPEYEASAKEIYNHTPEMLTYFSDILDYPYPWDKYAQVIARDYVSGAMENTSAVIFGEFVQKHKRELIDNDNDYIVAHEMFHHWFGDLVTCESWANLTLNEGFANYSEYLWAEHKYGRMKADHHRMNEMEGYLSSGELHPLIHYRYADKEDMFDAHSYNKGGLVLHMLRNYVGDKAFFASLNKYLVDNKFTAVEVDELRMAFEDTIGEDLNWFFDQWYNREGHPIINVKYDYKPADKVLNIYTYQAAKHNFNMPYKVAMYDFNGNVSYQTLWVENETDTFKIDNVGELSAYVFDGTNTNLSIISEEGKTPEQYLNQFKYSELFFDKFIAFTRTEFNSEEKMAMAFLALEEPYYLFRTMALEFFAQSSDPSIISADKLIKLASSDPHSSVRLAALGYLSTYPELDLVATIEDILNKEQAYPVLSFALGYLSSIDYKKSVTYAKQFESEKTDQLNDGIAAVYSQAEEHVHADWFEKTLKSSKIFTSTPVYMSYTAYTLKHDPQRTSSLIDELLTGALDKNNGLYQRYFHTLTLAQMKGIIGGSNNNSMKDKINVAIDVIKEKEESPMLKSYYQQM